MVEFCHSGRLPKDFIYLYSDIQVVVAIIVFSESMVGEHASPYTQWWIGSQLTVIANNPSERVVRK
jgi:hypothetical protein